MSNQVLGLIIPGMTLIMAFGALILWLRDRASRYLLGFVVAPLTIGTSLSISHFTTGPDELVSGLGIYTCSVTACIAMAWAVCTRVRKVAPVMAWCVAALVGGMLDGAAIVTGSFTASLFLVNSMCGIVFVTSAQLLAQTGSREIVDRVLLVLFVVIAAQFFLRPAGVVIVEGTMTAEQYRGSVGHAILTVSAAILTLMLAAAVLAAVLQDQIRDLKVRVQSDPLTGLPLRRAFEDEVDRLLSESDDRETSISLIIADIDHFKQVNDLWGHQAGDRAIAAFGQLVGGTIRGTDRAGRIGGEEFCILVWDCAPEEATGLAERLREAFFAMTHEGINDDVRLTASFGVTKVHRGEGYVRAFSRADRALYDAKQAGRNRVVLADRRSATDRVAEPLADAPTQGSIASAA